MKKLFCLIICLVMLSSCSKENNENSIYLHSWITGDNVHFEYVHNKTDNLFTLFVNPETIIDDLTERDCYLYNDTENSLIYYKIYGGIFHIVCLGQNSINENAYDYNFRTDEICIMEYFIDHDCSTGKEVTRRRIIGFITFPSNVWDGGGYTLEENVECSFEDLTSFYSHIPQDAEIDQINKTITLDLYGVKSETHYAVIRHNGESFEITLEEY